MNPGPPDWSKFFAAHPELSPPGYEETVAIMRARKEGRKQSKKTGKH